MFEFAHFSALDDPDFKEDAVREEIIAPLLKELGYGISGDSRVVRSKSLRHPFVKVGTRSVPVRLVPDYTLYHHDKVVLILDAKSPAEAIVDCENVQQAYSYAIHPEIRSKHFALCNGRALALYDIDTPTPIIHLPIAEWKHRWLDVVRHFSPISLLHPKLRTYDPDAGRRVSRLGLTPHDDISFLDIHIQFIGKVSDTKYSMSSAFDIAGVACLASFDFSPMMLDKILECLAKPLRDGVLAAMSHWPFQASLDAMVAVDCQTHLGEPTVGEDELFVPFIVDDVFASRFDREPPIEMQPLPDHFHSLKASFQTLRGAPRG